MNREQKRRTKKAASDPRASNQFHGVEMTLRLPMRTAQWIQHEV